MKILFTLLLTLLSTLQGAKKPPPNVIIIFTDDQGYSDLSCFGSKTIQTPHIDRLAQEGRKFTSFLVACPVCSPSRAALLTGCYPKRISMHRHVLFPDAKHGLNPKEYTLANHFSSHDYATACIGKWHLGHLPEVLPRAHGFDFYYGIPYSNDMHQPTKEGDYIGFKAGRDQLWKNQNSTLTKWHTPLLENETTIELPVDQRTITRRYTDRALQFITTSAREKKPFFLYLPHSMPHVPLYVPDDVHDPNPKNAYINVIKHIDTQVGRITDTLRQLELAQDTILIYTSDNGPWLQFKHHAGSAGALRDGKGTNFEGGQRVPCVMWAPGRIPANTTSNELLTTLDLLPSLATLTDTKLPANQATHDGHDAALTITTDRPSPRQEFLYYTAQGKLGGIRIGPWKFLFGGQKKVPKPLLFNLQNDLGEKNNLIAEHPEITARLQKRAQEIDAEITQNARPLWGQFK